MEQQIGTLYIVATPIGNARDMSERARTILETADLIAAEDTRRSVVLLNKLGVRGVLSANHKFNEHGKAKWFVAQLLAGNIPKYPLKIGQHPKCRYCDYAAVCGVDKDEVKVRSHEKMKNKEVFEKLTEESSDER